MGAPRMSNNPPAGWYPDPDGSPGRQRYYDGEKWTEHKDYPPPRIPSKPMPTWMTVVLTIGAALAAAGIIDMIVDRL